MLTIEMHICSKVSIFKLNGSLEGTGNSWHVYVVRIGTCRFLVNCIYVVYCSRMISTNLKRGRNQESKRDRILQVLVVRKVLK